jgi:hypothetical protein
MRAVSEKIGAPGELPFKVHTTYDRLAAVQYCQSTGRIRTRYDLLE